MITTRCVPATKPNVKPTTDAINIRIEQVGVERAYRIVGMLEQTAQMLKQDVVERLQRFKESWRRKVLWLDGIVLAAAVIAFFTLTIWGGYWAGGSLSLPFWDLVTLNELYFLRGDWPYFWRLPVTSTSAFAHGRPRKISARLLAEVKDSDLHPNYQSAFRKSARWWRSIFCPNPAGWGRRTAARLEKVLDDSNAYIEKLNDKYTNPSGRDNRRND